MDLNFVWRLVRARLAARRVDRSDGLADHGREELGRHSWTGQRIEIVRHKRRGPPWTAGLAAAKEQSALNQFPAHPCFRVSAQPPAVKLAEKNHLFFR